MNYEEIEVTSIDGEIYKHIILDLGDGAFKSFPAIEGNPEYDAWLETQPPTEGTK